MPPSATEMYFNGLARGPIHSVALHLCRWWAQNWAQSPGALTCAGTPPRFAQNHPAGLRGFRHAGRARVLMVPARARILKIGMTFMNINDDRYAHCCVPGERSLPGLPHGRESQAYGGKFIRCRRSWKRGSERRLLNPGQVLSQTISLSRCSYACSSQSNAFSFSPSPK